MNLSLEIETRVLRARTWIATITQDGGLPAFVESTRAESNAVSMRVTAVAAHLYAWLFTVTGRDEDRRTARQFADTLAAAFDAHGSIGSTPERPEAVSFFDLGTASRALYAVGKTTHRADLWDRAIQIGSQMRRFRHAAGYYRELPFGETANGDHGETAFGVEHRKAAIAWKSLKTPADYDDLDQFLYLTPPPAEPNVKRVTDETRVIVETGVDQLRDFGLHCEALVMGEASDARARDAFALFDSRVSRSAVSRSDVLAQHLRLHLLLGNPLQVLLVDRLSDLQDGNGGFYERVFKGKPVYPLDVVATLYAIQALVMAESPDFAKLPGPLGRRDLAIV